MLRRSLVRLVLWTASSLSAGCREQPIAAPATVVQAAITSATTLGDVLWIPAEIEGGARSLVIVDTGSPFTILSPRLLRGVLPRGDARARSLSLGGAIFADAPVVPFDGNLPSAPNGGVTGGIAGFSSWGSSLLALDYRAPAVGIGAETTPADAAEPVRIAFALEGGGRHSFPHPVGDVAFPATRIVINAEVEGRSLHLLLDTGANWICLCRSVFRALANDERSTVEAFVSGVDAPTTGTIFRLRSVSLGEGTVIAEPLAASSESIDAHLDDLSTELNRSVDGLLGASFLRNFDVVVDYAGRELRLRRYHAARNADRYRRVGIELGRALDRKGNVKVRRVFPGSDAERQQIRVGDEILAIDGTPLADRAIDANALLEGDSGIARVLTLVGRSVTARVENLLPLETHPSN